MASPLTHLLEREVIRQAEQHLEAQAARAFSADARAMAMMSGALGLAVACFGLAVAIPQIEKTAALEFASFVAAGCVFLLAAVIAYRGGQPATFYFIGNHPKLLRPFVQTQIDHESQFWASYMNSLAERIDANEGAIVYTARATRHAAKLCVLGLLTGGFYFAIGKAVSNADMLIPMLTALASSVAKFAISLCCS